MSSIPGITIAFLIALFILLIFNKTSIKSIFKGKINYFNFYNLNGAMVYDCIVVRIDDYGCQKCGNLTDVYFCSHTEIATCKDCDIKKERGWYFQNNMREKYNA